MKFTDAIFKALERAELEIRQIGADAFRMGHDVDANFARDVVVGLKALLKSSNEQEGLPRPSLDVINKQHRPPTRAALSVKNKYPKYEIKNDTLYRTGWSKKSKSEYTHKAPRQNFERTIKALERASKDGPGPYTAERIIEYTSDSTGTVPSYQAYLVIGLLKENECVQQVGRDGYRIEVGVLARAEKIWNQYTRS